MTSFSLRGIDEQAKKLLKAEAKRTGKSINALILGYIHDALGQTPAKPYREKHHELDRLAGTWSAAEAREFYRATRDFEEVDEDLWK